MESLYPIPMERVLMARPPNGVTHIASFTCCHCSTRFSAPLSQRKLLRTFCSRKCYGRYRSENISLSREHYEMLGKNQLGENNPNWKGGKEHNLEVARIWRRNNRDSINQRNANRRALVRGALGSFSLEDWLRLKQSYDYTCQMCGLRELEITLTRDHIIPLSRGGQNVIENIQPLCLSCNSSKKAKVIPGADGVDIEV